MKKPSATQQGFDRKITVTLTNEDTSNQTSTNTEWLKQKKQVEELVFKVGNILKRNKQVNFAEQDEAISANHSTSNSRPTSSCNESSRRQTTQEGFKINFPKLDGSKSLLGDTFDVRLPKQSPQTLAKLKELKIDDSQINLVARGLEKTEQSIV